MRSYGASTCNKYFPASINIAAQHKRQHFTAEKPWACWVLIDPYDGAWCVKAHPSDHTDPQHLQVLEWGCSELVRKSCGQEPFSRIKSNFCVPWAQCLQISHDCKNIFSVPRSPSQRTGYNWNNSE